MIDIGVPVSSTMPGHINYVLDLDTQLPSCCAAVDTRLGSAGTCLGFSSALPFAFPTNLENGRYTPVVEPTLGCFTKCRVQDQFVSAGYTPARNGMEGRGAFVRWMSLRG